MKPNKIKGEKIVSGKKNLKGIIKISDLQEQLLTNILEQAVYYGKGIIDENNNIIFDNYCECGGIKLPESEFCKDCI